MSFETSEKISFSKNDYLFYLREMLTARKLEDLCYQLYSLGKIKGFMHLYNGQEAVAVGVLSQINKDDSVFSHYREHVHALMKGIPLKQIISELLGKETGCSRGYGGSMHLFSKEHHFFGGNAIVGAHISHAVGKAFAEKLKKTNKQTLCFMGDGAVAEGISYEAFNLASLWNIPILFCCENNFYAMGTSLKKSHANTDLSSKAKIHHIESQQVDGMNILDVINHTKKALSYIKKYQRPYFIEFLTYRFRAHSMFDPELYRSKDEVDLWKKKDPINQLVNLLLDERVFNLIEFQSIQRDLENGIDKELKDALTYAENSSMETEDAFLKFWEK